MQLRQMVQTLKVHVEQSHGGQVYMAAEALGVTPRTIYKRLEDAYVINGKLYVPTQKVKK